MRGHVHSSPDDIDITSLFSALKRNIVRLLVLSLLAGLLTFGILSAMAPKYKSTAKLLFGGESVTDPFRDPKLQPNAPDAITVKVDKEAVASQVSLIKSRDLAVKLIDKLKLKGRASFNTQLPSTTALGGVLRMVGLSGPRPGETVEDVVLSNYYNALRVYQAKNTRVIIIEFSASDPQLAARAANTLADLYLMGRARQGVRQSAGASQWLGKQIANLTVEVRRADADVQAFRARYDLLAGTATTANGRPAATLNDEQLTELNRELTKARALKSEADARARAIRELMLRGSADASPDVLRSPLIQRLLE
ncbi:MAG: Wzz/FepE/Etk N-terminal domain-containing protein, partial [Pseudomonadota bacterium]